MAIKLVTRFSSPFSVEQAYYNSLRLCLNDSSEDG